VNGQDGAVSLLMLAVGAMTVVLAVLIADIGGFLAAHLQASAAADAAALAAAPVTFRPFGSAGSPAGEAARFASANGARLVSCRCPVDPSWARREVEVVVGVPVELIVFGVIEAQARSLADFVPTELVGEALPGSGARGTGGNPIGQVAVQQTLDVPCQLVQHRDGRLGTFRRALGVTLQDGTGHVRDLFCSLDHSPPCQLGCAVSCSHSTPDF